MVKTAINDNIFRLVSSTTTFTLRTTYTCVVDYGFWCTEDVHLWNTFTENEAKSGNPFTPCKKTGLYKSFIKIYIILTIRVTIKIYEN